MRRRLSLGLLAFLVLSTAAVAATSQTRTVSGTVTLPQFNLAQRCGAKQGGTAAKPLYVVTCSVVGSFKGKPAVAGASYYWTWDLELVDGRTTGKGPEKGRIGLNFGSGAIVYLTTKGMQKPVGTPTSTRSRAQTKGTWKVSKGQGAYKGAKGSGTYAFSTTLENGQTFTTAKLVLRGKITTKP